MKIVFLLVLTYLSFGNTCQTVEDNSSSEECLLCFPDEEVMDVLLPLTHSEHDYAPRNLRARVSLQNCSKTSPKPFSNVKLLWNAPTGANQSVHSYVVYVRDPTNRHHDYKVIYNNETKVEAVFEQLRCNFTYVFSVRGRSELSYNSTKHVVSPKFVDHNSKTIVVSTGVVDKSLKPLQLNATVLWNNCHLFKEDQYETVKLSWSAPNSTRFPVHSYVVRAVNADARGEELLIYLPNRTDVVLEKIKCGATYIITVYGQSEINITSVIDGSNVTVTLDLLGKTVVLRGDILGRITVVTQATTVHPGAVTTSHGNQTTPHCNQTTSHGQQTTSHGQQTASPGKQTTSHGKQTTHEGHGGKVTTVSTVTGGTGGPGVPDPGAHHADEPAATGLSTSSILMMVLIPLACIALGIAGYFAYKKVKDNRDHGLLSNAESP